MSLILKPEDNAEEFSREQAERPQVARSAGDGGRAARVLLEIGEGDSRRPGRGPGRVRSTDLLLKIKGEVRTRENIENEGRLR